MIGEQNDLLLIVLQKKLLKERGINKMEKTIWLENLVLFNSCVQKSGGIMDIVSSYTQPEGDVLVRVVYNKLDNDQRIRYEKERRYK